MQKLLNLLETKQPNPRPRLKAGYVLCVVSSHFVTKVLSLACLLAQRLSPGGDAPEPCALALRFSPSLVSVTQEAQLCCGVARSHTPPMQLSQAHPRLGQSACAEPLFKAVFASFRTLPGSWLVEVERSPFPKASQQKQCNLSCSLGSSCLSCLDSDEIGTGLWLIVVRVGTGPLGKARGRGKTTIKGQRHSLGEVPVPVVVMLWLSRVPVG